MAYKYVYLFSEGNGSMRELLGGKGANLAEMTNIGLPVPQGFIISTEACTRYYEDNESIAPEIEAEIFEYLHKIEEINDKKLGDPAKPLLVSVRSGARASMPGMMDTILNLGINDEVAAGLIAGNSDPKFERFVYDSYRRFVQMYSDVVMGLSKKRFETIIDEIKEKKGVKQDIELDTEDLKEMLQLFREFYKKELGEEFPQDPNVQLMGAVKAVFRSWNNERAIFYRKMNEIPSSWGTAVSVMPMVFGNLNNNSGTGVAFTRNPATGEKGLFGEFLMNAQGEDVVAGVRTPSSIDELAQTNPDVYKQFSEIANRLENHYRDMQDMEFTIENGKLYMLQTRNGKRTAAAALRVACDLVDEGMISKEEALLMVDPKQLDALLHPQFDADALKKATVVASALPASPGAACGQVVFSAEEAIEEAERVLENIYGYDVTMPIYIDLEGAGDTARTKDLTREEYTKIVNAFCNRIEKEGYRGGVYSNENWIKSHLNWEDLTQWDLWLAKYTKVPDTDHTFNMWQYTASATIDGIEKECDLNVRVYKK